MRTATQAAREIEDRTRPNIRAKGLDGDACPPKKVDARRVLENLKLGKTPDQVFIAEALRDGRATVQEIKMKHIIVDPVNRQARHKTLDHDHVKKLADIRDIDGGGFLHPVLVFLTPAGKFLLADGFHRHEENRLRKGETIRAYVVDVEDWEHESRLFAAMCNRELCLPRTLQDKRKAVEILFADPVCWEWSDERVGRLCGVGQNTVRNYKKEFGKNHRRKLPRIVLNSKGKKIDYYKSIPRETLTTKREYKKYVINPVFRDRKSFRSHFNSQVVRGRTPEIVLAKVDELKNETIEKRILLNITPLLELLSDNCIASKKFFVDFGCDCQIFAIKAAGALLIPLTSPGFSAIRQAIGDLHLLIRNSRQPNIRRIIVCYADDYPCKLLGLARQDGIEFLSPDELVASLKPTAKKGDP